MTKELCWVITEDDSNNPLYILPATASEIDAAAGVADLRAQRVAAMKKANDAEIKLVTAEARAVKAELFKLAWLTSCTGIVAADHDGAMMLRTIASMWDADDSGMPADRLLHMADILEPDTIDAGEGKG